MRKLQILRDLPRTLQSWSSVSSLDKICAHGIASLAHAVGLKNAGEFRGFTFFSFLSADSGFTANHGARQSLHTSRFLPAYQAPTPWALPADEWEARRAKRAHRSQAAAVQRIRSCCTIEELSDELPSRGAAPELVVQAALQTPRVMEWPLTPEDRRRLFGVLEHLTQQCAMHMEQYDMSELASLLGVCARTRFVPGDLLVPLQHRLEADMREKRIKDQTGAENLAALLTHLAQLRPGSRLLWNAAAAAAESVVRFGNTADIAKALSALVRVNMLQKPLCDRAMAAAQRALDSAQPQDVALLMRSLSRAGSSLPPALVEQLGFHLEERGTEYDLSSLAELAAAVAQLGLRKRELRYQLAQLGAEVMWRQVSVLQAPVVPGLTPPPGPPGRRPAGHPEPVTPRTVLALVTGIGFAHPPETPLLQAAAALLVTLLRRAAAAPGSVHDPVDWQCVDGVVALMGEAGMQEERKELLRQVSGLRERMAAL